MYLLIILSYFALVWLISFLASRKQSNNDTFFTANRNSLWWAVAIGMLGSSMSGISVVSVPGMVGGIQFTYLQTVIGFFFGYIVVANVLLPLYYKLNLTSIYTYLQQRFGVKTYKTGAWFFIISKMIGSAAKLYIVALILQKFLFDVWNIPFWLTVSICVSMIWIYTARGGIKAIVWTDVLQTLVMVVAIVMIVIEVYSRLNMNVLELSKTLFASEQTRIFVFDDWVSKQNFFKQFFSGIFIVIVMTGLDQDIMQKNLTCKNLREAKRNMYCCGISFLPVNFLFLLLGVMLLLLARQNNIILPNAADEILPMFASGFLGKTVTILFLIAVIAAALNSADSALTAITTSFSIDILDIKRFEKLKAERYRKTAHAAISAIFIIIILLFRAMNDKSIIDMLYTIVSYTYGPLLGMYAFGLITKCQTYDRAIPFIAVMSPCMCYALNISAKALWNYSFGYELLMLNGVITFAGMMIFRKKNTIFAK